MMKASAEPRFFKSRINYVEEESFDQTQLDYAVTSHSHDQ